MTHTNLPDRDWPEWEEGGTLGNSEEHAIARPRDDAKLDEALGLQSISIRLQKSLLEELKLIAGIHQIGYQPLIKQVLQRFVEAEMRAILRKHAEHTKAKEVLVQQQEQAKKAG